MTGSYPLPLPPIDGPPESSTYPDFPQRTLPYGRPLAPSNLPRVRRRRRRGFRLIAMADRQNDEEATPFQVFQAGAWVYVASPVSGGIINPIYMVTSRVTKTIGYTTVSTAQLLRSRDEGTTSVIVEDLTEFQDRNASCDFAGRVWWCENSAGSELLLYRSDDDLDTVTLKYSHGSTSGSQDFFTCRPAHHPTETNRFALPWFEVTDAGGGALTYSLRVLLSSDSESFASKLVWDETVADPGTSDPAIFILGGVWLESDRLIIAFNWEDGGTANTFVTYSDDIGDTWTTPDSVASINTADGLDDGRKQLLASGTSVFLFPTETDAADSPIGPLRSLDSGENWSAVGLPDGFSADNHKFHDALLVPTAAGPRVFALILNDVDVVSKLWELTDPLGAMEWVQDETFLEVEGNDLDFGPFDLDFRSLEVLMVSV